MNGRKRNTWASVADSFPNLNIYTKGATSKAKMSFDELSLKEWGSKWAQPDH